MKLQRVKADKGTRYDIQYQVVRGRKLPFVYFESSIAFNLLDYTIAEAEDIYLQLTKIF